MAPLKTSFGIDVLCAAPSKTYSLSSRLQAREIACRNGAHLLNAQRNLMVIGKSDDELLFELLFKSTVFTMERNWKRLRLKIKVTKHTPRRENRCATVFTSF